MGGGVGISQPATSASRPRIPASPCPRPAIGLFPDVGGGWYLPRLPGRIGQFLALTGARLDGAECLALGLATHYVASDWLDEVKAADRRRAAADRRRSSTRSPTTAPGRAIARPSRARSTGCSPPTARGHLRRARSRRRRLGRAASSPLLRTKARRREGLAAAARRRRDQAELRRRDGAGICARAPHVVQRHDFLEGVRAVMSTRTMRPRWNPPTPEGVTDEMHRRRSSRPCPPSEAWTPYPGALERMSRLRNHPGRAARRGHADHAQPARRR